MNGSISYSEVIARAEFVRDRAAEHQAQGKEFFYVPAPGLGWEIAPNARHSSLDSTSDELGLRRSRPAGTPTPPNLPRISFWGDSICEGCEVPDEDTWLWLLQEAMEGEAIIHNGGVSAYGTDQALLRFEARQSELASDIAVLCYPTADLERNVNIQRMFLMQPCDLLFLKPRFERQHGELKLISPPDMTFENMVDVLRRPETRAHLKRHDAFYPRPRPNGVAAWIKKRYRHFFGISNHRSNWENIREEALDTTAGIFQRFSTHCAALGIQGIILFLPVLTGRNASGDDFDILMDRLTEMNCPFVDLRPTFADIPQQDLSLFFMPKNHYTRASGERIRETLAPYFRRLLNRPSE